jgi:hypothetical protein
MKKIADRHLQTVCENVDSSDLDEIAIHGEV